MAGNSDVLVVVEGKGFAARKALVTQDCLDFIKETLKYGLQGQISAMTGRDEEVVVSVVALNGSVSRG